MNETRAERFTITLAVSGELSAADRRALCKAIKAAVEHFRMEVGLTPDDSPACVREVHEVAPAEEWADLAADYDDGFRATDAEGRNPDPDAPRGRPWRCEFTPQAWVNDYALNVDPEGETRFVALIEGDPRALNDYQRDELREQGPEWMREWSGPFEVEVLSPADDAEPRA